MKSQPHSDSTNDRSASAEAAEPAAPVRSAFLTTHWSVVLAAAGSDSNEALAALQILCETYWYPLYAFVRRNGFDAADAEDLIQEFLSGLLCAGSFPDVDRSRGRFRAFLLASLKHFLANEHDRRKALKRGGGKPAVSIDQAVAEGWYRLEPTDSASPDQLFERRWALTLLDRVYRTLRQEYVHASRESLFESLKGALAGVRETESAAAIGRRLGMTEGAVRVAAHRLRQRYRELLRDEISQTVGSQDEVDAEIRHLFNVFA